MLVTVYCVRRDLSEITFSLEVDADFELQNFKALCEMESGIPAAESQIVYAETPLTDSRRSLASYGLRDGDVVILRQLERSQSQSQFPDFSSIAVPGPSNSQQQLQPPPPQQRQPRPTSSSSTSSPQGLDNPGLLRDMLLANPHELSLLKERNPPLAEALLSGDLEKFTKVLQEQQQERARRERERLRLIAADPFDLEAQAKIEEDIRQQNIEENMTIAMEEAPESFGQVVMLYINCKVNGHPVKAFVDSGAQMTIMSQACADRCNIMRLVDRRWEGIAKGVGTQKIIGRVHLAQVQIEGDFLPCSFSILEDQPMDMLLGLDMLKRHQCSIDLKKNVLVIGTTGTQTQFLPEGELPECARLAYGQPRDDLRPDEIADRELAEALQKSADEADKEDKTTTSLEPPLLPTPREIKRPIYPTGEDSHAAQPQSQEMDSSITTPPSLSSQKSFLKGEVKPQSMESLQMPGEKVHTGLEDLSLPPSTANDSLTSQVDFNNEHMYTGEPFHSQNPFNELISSETSNAAETTIGFDTNRGQKEDTSVQHEITGSAHQTKILLNSTSHHSEHLEFSPVGEISSNLQPQEELGNETIVCEKREPSTHELSPGNVPIWESPVGMELQENIEMSIANNLLSNDKTSQLQEMALRSCAENSIPASAASAASEATKAVMEINLCKSPINMSCDVEVEAEIQENANGASLNQEESLMEVDVEASKCVLPLSDEIGQAENSGNGTGTSIQNLDKAESASPCSPMEEQSSLPDPYQNKSTDSSSIEEPCLSLAAALMELHQLLVASHKESSRTLFPNRDDSCQLISAPKEQDQLIEPSDQCAQNAPSTETPCSIGKLSDGLAVLLGDSNTCDLTPCVNETNVEPRDESSQQAAQEKAQEITGVQSEGTPVSLKIGGTADLQKPMQQVESSETSSVVPDLKNSTNEMLVKDFEVASDAAVNSNLIPVGESPEKEVLLHSNSSSTSEALMAQSGPTEPLADRPPSASLLEPGSAAVPPAQFPVADINRIMRSGFTMQEAAEALEQFHGNADLALLTLLARKIVVPT
ncbi:protein DDI1 homolog 2 isoform X2 [Latimeria chalumnae]|uniref:protein DDI1 homolog 2 isoform X2 n=1 Tax=Latimeria chalumnae TaxID=7897 RepID=UPI0003C11607|nr:PREDICTED: regulatory solute carrier protein family 1 member 1-like isoform X2 [Latimeria chalumnae]|eukprot:XP_006004329.1 PREDICTED: regulatory solute carrier protein family 1 member 1-like isoform X2 [Latimeria chalumnae]